MKLLLVDDDPVFTALLQEQLEKRGHAVRIAHDVAEGLAEAVKMKPEAVLLDLKMPGPSGLAMIPELLRRDPSVRIVVLTGYAGISTAIEAIKLGALHYLSKPVSIEEILAAFARKEGDPAIPVDNDPVTLFNAERDHILSTLARHGQNISAAARELGLHRRTLQRKLNKLR